MADARPPACYFQYFRSWMLPTVAVAGGWRHRDMDSTRPVASVQTRITVFIRQYPYQRGYPALARILNV
jgi:hypothetical protein